MSILETIMIIALAISLISLGALKVMYYGEVRKVLKELNLPNIKVNRKKVDMYISRKEK